VVETLPSMCEVLEFHFPALLIIIIINFTSTMTANIKIGESWRMLLKPFNFPSFF
jgi:hypothetical protein